MKRILLTVGFLLVANITGFAQNAASTNNLRGLTGVAVNVAFARADALPEAERPAVLEALKADTLEKLKKAGIPVLRGNDEIQKAGAPRLLVLVTLDQPNGMVHPLVTEVKLMQRVRLERDLSIETEAVTWSRDAVAGPKLEKWMIQKVAGSLVDRFIEDYRSVNLTNLGSQRKQPTKVEARILTKN